LVDFERVHVFSQYADVNAFLTLAATRHTLLVEDLPGKVRAKDIVAAAKAGRVPVHLVSSSLFLFARCRFHFNNVILFPDLSEKNPIEILAHNATLLSLLAIFSRGTHRSLYIQLVSFLARSITTSSVNQVC
jgi:hypothetical protein